MTTMDFKVQYVNGVESAVFADGSTKWIYNHDKYGKYFAVDNMLNNDEETPASVRKLFSHRIKDAVETIRNGDGDVIEAKHILGRNLSVRVLHFLDREIGEELRQESIKGWADTEFGWCVSLGNKNSFSGCFALSKTYDTDQPCVFNTQEEAAAFAADMVDTARRYAKEYSKNALNASEDEKSESFNAVVSDITEKYGESSLMVKLFGDMISDDDSIKDNLDAFTYRIEQCVSKN